MTKRIFRSICVVSLAILVVAMVLVIRALYNYFAASQQEQIKAQARLASVAIENEGADYFESLNLDQCRVTWIDSDGTVLADSMAPAAEMENHLDREEVQEALTSGRGESVRYSSTLTERSLYAAILQPDGTVVRVSATQVTLFTLLMGIFPHIALTLAVALLLAFLLASYESRRLVKPLNELNLDAPLQDTPAVYEELTPLVRRIASQQHQLKQHAAELRRRQDEFRAVTDGLADGLILLNEEGTVLSINRAAARLMPARPKHGKRPWAEGRNVSDLTPALGLESLLAAARTTGRVESSVCIHNLSYRLHVDPIMSDGVRVGFAVLIVNVTEQVQHEKLRREFTANVSHELKTPIHSIAGCSELLASGMVAPEDVPRFAGQIYTESRRMIRLVDDIIKLSHLDEGAEELTMTQVDLYTVVESVVMPLIPEAEAAGITLTLSGEQGMWLHGIPQQLGAIVTNLCSNAIKYNRPEGNVTVTLTRTDDTVTLTVADTGIGIPAEHHDRIFERFYRVDKSRSKAVGGTGLGLSIVKHAVLLHDGTIDLESREGEGTTMTVTFPALTPPPEKER